MCSARNPSYKPLDIELLETRRLLATVGFEGLPIGPVGDPVTGVYNDPSGFRFALRSAGGGSPGKASQVYGGPQGFPSKVLHAPEWGQQYVISRQDGQPFDFLSLEHAASRYGDAGDFVLTGVFPGGNIDQQTVNFSNSKTPVTFTSAYIGITELRIAFAGGTNNAYGALDNFVFEEGEFGGGGTAQLAGSLAGFANDVEDAARLSFDDRTWHEIDDLLPLADGSFYSIGRSGDENETYPRREDFPRSVPLLLASFITKHNPDGSIDRSFGAEGRARLSEFPHALGLIESPAGGFYGIQGAVVTRYTNELAVDTAFGGGDGQITLPSTEKLFFRAWTGGFVTQTARTQFGSFDGAGAQVAFADVQPLLDATAPSSLHIPYPAFDIDEAGGLYLTWSGDVVIPDSGHRHELFAARLSPDLTLDATYGEDGIATLEQVLGSEDHPTPLDIFVGPTGRAMVFNHEGDGDINLHFVTAAGEWDGAGGWFSSRDNTAHDRTVEDVAFYDDGGFAIAFTEFEDFPPSLFGSSSREHSFGVNRSARDHTQLYAFETPAQAHDVFQTPDGSFVFGGWIEDIAFDGPADFPITNIDHLGGLWHIEGHTRVHVVLDFETAPTGPIPSGVYTEDGFVLRNLPGGPGSALEPLVIHGQQQGYVDKVISTSNWARRIVVTQEDGLAFFLEGFECAAGRWGEAGDVILTGTRPNGQAINPLTLSFDAKEPPRNLGALGEFTSLTFNFAGGVNNAYGVLDNIQLVVDDDVTVDVESAPLGPIPSGIHVEDGFTFTNRPGSGGTSTEPLQVLGAPQGFASKALQTTNWGRRIDIARGGELFSLKRLDYAAGRWGEAGDFVLTGTFAGGGTDTRSATFSNKTLSTLELDWEDLTSVSINWAGGANNAYGTIDNLVFTA